jgi:uncharacterized protein (DUF362 family)
MAKVALIRCMDYEEENVLRAVRKGLDLIGGASQFAKPGESILLKPNMLAGDAPGKCTTTHPSVFKAVGQVFLETGANINYGDSPGFGSPESVSKKTEIGIAASDLGIPLADFVQGREILFAEAVQNKKFFLANGVLDSDGIISLPKLKAHAFAKITGAIKNQFGCVPGTRKAEYHVKIPDSRNFARMLVDLNAYLKPRLYIMDGILAMEGNGPRGGNPKPMNVILFSTDPIALDATICRMMRLDPSLVPTIVYGAEANLGTYQEKEIEILGDNLESFMDPTFEVNREVIKQTTPSKTFSWIRNSLVNKPVIDEKKCVKCGVCVQVCPVKPKAVDWHDGTNHDKVPTYKYERCIRCFCCQELCPESAIYIKPPWFRKVIRKIFH